VRAIAMADAGGDTPKDRVAVQRVCLLRPPGAGLTKRRHKITFGCWAKTRQAGNRRQIAV